MMMAMVRWVVRQVMVSNEKRDCDFSPTTEAYFVPLETETV